MDENKINIIPLNVERNNCKHISVYEGDASLLENKNYDLIIANINRNILLTDMKV